jgi:hypothetical protein
MIAAAVATPFPGNGLAAWGVEPLTYSESLDVRAGESIAYWMGYAMGYACGALVEATVIGRLCRRLGGICG